MPRQLLQSLDICRLLVIIDSMFSWTNLGRNIQGDSDCWSLSRMRFRLLNFVKSAIQIVDICEEWNSNCWFLSRVRFGLLIYVKSKIQIVELCEECDSDCWYLWRVKFKLLILSRVRFRLLIFVKRDSDFWSFGRAKLRLLIFGKREIQIVDSCEEGNSGCW